MTDIVQRNVSVSMIRDNLEDIPGDTWPMGVSLRWYQPGDEWHWLRIHELADQYNTVTHDLYVREFGLDAAVLSQRQAYLVVGQDELVGTATAWWNEDYHGQPYGRLHWVAIVPEMQGRKLARPLLSAVCRRMKALGDKRAYLVTSTGRVAAINLYVRFGFVPEIRCQDDLAVWRQMQPYVKGRLLLEHR
ncbi:MAG: GNAT family N-acetyltransferase [Anaerolineae bacterium]|nr:GNAT family N-acetyltransferase [Anaerolineae bacterium]